MPYIDNQAALSAIVGSIPNAETAKMAIIRPTTHFAIVTADNPDMVRTMELQAQQIEAELAGLAGLTPDDLAERKRALERAFQQRVTDQATLEQQGLLHTLRAHGVVTADILEDKGKLETAEFAYFTDQIFATDTGQYYDDEGVLSFIPSSFRNRQRQGEERLAMAQAENIGARVYPLYAADGRKLIFEGGDIRQMPGKKLFFIGQGHRSDPGTSQAIAAVSNYYVLPIILLQEQFYHLDCCFLPLPNDSAVIYEGDYVLTDEGHHVLDVNGWPALVAGTETMLAESRALIRTVYPAEKLVLINKSEAMAFATNAAVLQSAIDGRFKMFVNGNRSTPINDETLAINEHLISYTAEHLEAICRVTGGLMDIVELPYKTMHGSGGSVRCTVQEVACTTEALSPHKGKPTYFSERVDALEKQLYERRRLPRFFIEGVRLQRAEEQDLSSTHVPHHD